MFRVARSAAVLGARAVAQRAAFRSSAPSKQASRDPAALASGIVGTLNRRIVEPVLYNLRVVLEVIRTSAAQQQMSPLALPGQLAEAREGLVGFFRSFSTGTWRNVSVGQLRSMAARGLEVLGFFTVGEMIGRRNIIGYKVEGARTHSGHH
ncbi:mitochondrial ATP synthase g subunit-domain-containing protein [Hyaloraphidium curvatum]|nr:mitochondrial ATP synthase g subunit-domain-containing protein [Hyaloraphidium curvatum]